MADIQKIVPSLQKDMRQFKDRLEKLTPLLDDFVEAANSQAAQVESLVMEDKVETSILAHIQDALMLHEVHTEQLYSRHQSAIERILEAAAHLQEVDTLLQKVAARQAAFERLNNREKGNTNETI